jgi:hypothetical protein
MARTPPSRISRDQILRDLRAASRKGDRAALTLAVGDMRTLALSPRYWERYLALLRNPLARLVDLLVIKQGERIAHQKGWTLRRAAAAASPADRRRSAAKAAPPAGGRARARPPGRPRVSGAQQPSLF